MSVCPNVNYSLGCPLECTLKILKRAQLMDYLPIFICPPATPDHCNCTHSSSTGLHKDIEIYNKRYKSLDICYLHPSVKFIDVFIRKKS